MNETIICAAIWYKELPMSDKHSDMTPETHNPINIKSGVVFCGHRHPHCMYTMVRVTGFRSVDLPTEAGENVQGFLTSKNRFVDREEAAAIHIANGGKLNYSNTELYSEDLY